MVSSHMCNKKDGAGHKPIVNNIAPTTLQLALWFVEGTSFKQYQRSHCTTTDMPCYCVCVCGDISA